MNRTPRQPTLFSEQEDTQTPPPLNGRQCESCGNISFPPQDYGCDHCGGTPEVLKPFQLQGRGTLTSFATIHKHYIDLISTPFVMGTVQLADGPVIEALIECAGDSELSIGANMKAVLIENGENRDGAKIIDYRFSIDKDD